MKMLDKVELGKLTKLANFLDTVPEENFDLSWWGHETPAKMFLGLFKIEECGFAGCAMGWAAHAKLFDGFTMDTCSVHYEGAQAFKAVSLLFGFTQNNNKFTMAEYLFADGSYGYGKVLRRYPDIGWEEEIEPIPATPAMVAARIRKLVKKIEGRIARYKAKQTLDELKEAIHLSTAKFDRQIDRV